MKIPFEKKNNNKYNIVKLNIYSNIYLKIYNDT